MKSYAVAGPFHVECWYVAHRWCWIGSK